MELLQYLESILITVHNPVTFGPSDPVSLSRFLIRAATKPADEPEGTAPFLDCQARVLLGSEATLFTGSELEDNWRFYNSELIGVFQEANCPAKLFEAREDRYLYALTNIYAEEDTEVLLNAITFLPSPMRLWINGEPVLLGNHDHVIKDILLRVRLRQGHNPLLLEMPLGTRVPLTAQEFVLRLQPIERLSQNKAAYPYLDWERFEQLKTTLLVYPEHWNIRAGEPFSYAVLPGYIRQAPALAIEAVLENPYGRKLAGAKGRTGTLMQLNIPPEAAGLLVLKIKAVGKYAKPLLLYAGEYEADRNRLLQLAAEGKAAGIKEELESYRELLDLPAAFQSLNQYMPYDIRETVLAKLGELAAAVEAYAKQPAGTKPNGAATGTEAQEVAQAELAVPAKAAVPVSKPAAFAPNRRVVYRLRETGDAYLAYTVLLPEGYCAERSYPAVFYFHDAAARNYPTDLPWLKELPNTEAIIIQFVGIGRMNYTDDIQVVKTIRHIIAKWKLDRSRLFGIGFCSGTFKTYRTAFAVPDLFCAVATVSGEIAFNIYRPEYPWLDNVGDMPILGICGYENWFFNSTRLIDLLKRMSGAKVSVYSGFMHNELNTLHNSRALLHRLIGLTRNRFPEWLAFTPTDPCFVKSHWVQILKLSRPGDRTRVQADRVTPGCLEVETLNVDRLMLVLSRPDMQLPPQVTIAVNGQPYTVQLDDYTRIVFDLCLPDEQPVTEALTEQAFHEWYDEIVIDERQMGIKRLYLRRSVVVRPTVRNDLSAKLAYLLQNPVRDRYIFYRYETCRESELVWGGEEKRNLVLISDLRAASGRERQLMDAIGFTGDADGVRWKGEAFAGPSFGLLTAENPFAPDRMVMLAFYNSDALNEEFVALLNTFDTNPLFYQQALIYHQGRVVTFAEEAALTEITGGVR